MKTCSCDFVELIRKNPVTDESNGISSKTQRGAIGDLTRFRDILAAYAQMDAVTFFCILYIDNIFEDRTQGIKFFLICWQIRDSFLMKRDLLPKTSCPRRMRSHKSDP